MRFIRGLIGIIILVFLIVFSVGNREAVAVWIAPLLPKMDLPLYVPVLLALLVGYLLGGLMAWLAGAEGRRAKRRQKRRIKDLEKELKAVYATQGKEQDVLSAVDYDEDR